MSAVRWSALHSNAVLIAHTHTPIHDRSAFVHCERNSSGFCVGFSFWCIPKKKRRTFFLIWSQFVIDLSQFVSQMRCGKTGRRQWQRCHSKSHRKIDWLDGIDRLRCKTIASIAVRNALGWASIGRCGNCLFGFHLKSTNEKLIIASLIYAQRFCIVFSLCTDVQSTKQISMLPLRDLVHRTAWGLWLVMRH